MADQPLNISATVSLPIHTNWCVYINCVNNVNIIWHLCYCDAIDDIDRYNTIEPEKKKRTNTSKFIVKLIIAVYRFYVAEITEKKTHKKNVINFEDSMPMAYSTHLLLQYVYAHTKGIEGFWWTEKTHIAQCFIIHCSAHYNHVRRTHKSKQQPKKGGGASHAECREQTFTSHISNRVIMQAISSVLSQCQNACILRNSFPARTPRSTNVNRLGCITERIRLLFIIYALHMMVALVMVALVMVAWWWWLCVPWMCDIDIIQNKWELDSRSLY